MTSTKAIEMIREILPQPDPCDENEPVYAVLRKIVSKVDDTPLPDWLRAFHTRPAVCDPDDEWPVCRCKEPDGTSTCDGCGGKIRQADD